mmetsp:Transcript_106101/g.300188  ORF Transcript_106101/g.300188 Transcript_106101/m.300188 type:complete len:591 (+) Transcript_106101:58-1830(+)
MSRNRVLRRAGRPCGNNFAPYASVVDVEAAKCFWGGLTVDEKLSILHFEDPVIVSRVFSAQQELSRSDMLCYQLGLRGQDAVRARVGMDQFKLECEELRAGSMNPVAFYAKREFAERDDLFEHIEHRLGDAFLRKRPPLHRRDWPSTLEPTASSWTDFMGQILRLVGLAILQAQSDAGGIARTAVDAAAAAAGGDTPATADTERETEAAAEVCDEEVAAAIEASPKPQGRSAKRKARKRRGGNAVAGERDLLGAVTEHDSNAMPSTLGVSESEEFAAAHESASTQPPERGELSWPAGDLADEDAADSSGQRVKRLDGVPAGEGDSFLNFDWSTAGPPVDAAMESKVELQVDWSAHGPRLPESRWSAWLPNGAAEWHWIGGADGSEAGGKRGLRAFVRNTFVDVEGLDDSGAEEGGRARAQSMPAATVRRLRWPNSGNRDNADGMASAQCGAPRAAPRPGGRRGAGGAADGAAAPANGLVAEGETFLNFDWSPAGAPCNSMVESTVELQVDWSSHSPRLPETRWSAWLPNGQDGIAAEWHWTGTERSAGGRYRAFIRNTFVDVGGFNEPDGPTRARSVPVAGRSLEGKHGH